MTSRFVNLFKTGDHDELRAFQARVIAALKEVFPAKTVSALKDPREISVDGSTCGLPNIHAEFLLGDGTDDSLREVLRARFEALDLSKVVNDRGEIAWEGARKVVFPQLMPREFLAKVPLIHDDFFESLVLGFVLDTETAYSYIAAADVEKWGVTIDDIRDAAYENLAEKSQGLAINAFPGENGFVVINSMDGFDAVRITSREMRDFVAGIIGSPFCFGIPNRDFLICWAKSGDMEFQDNFARQISQDFDERPYPLSRRPFIVDEHGEISQVASGDDPRADTAQLN